MRSARVELILDTLRAVKGAKDLTKATDDVADSLGSTAREGAKAGRAVDKAGGEMSKAARAASSFDREVEKLSGSLRELAVAQALTGGDFSKQIREQETQLRRVSRNRKLLGDASEPADGFVASLSARLGPLLAKMPLSGPVGVAAVAAGVATAPLLGAVLAGGIIGGVGIGGVVGGFMVAKDDARVKAATEAMGKRIETRLQRAAAGLVGPTLAGIGEIEQALDTVDFDKIFRSSARYLPMLTGGVGSAITDLGDGVEDLAENAGPAVNAISVGIAGIGRTAGEGLESIADNGPEAAEALSVVFGLINSSITATFGLVNALTELYGWFSRIGLDLDAGLKLALAATGAEMDRNAFSARRVAEGTAGMGQEFQSAAAKAEALKQQQEALKAANEAVKVSQDALQRSLDGLGGKTTTAGRNAEALRTAMDNLYGAAIRQTEANEGYQASWDSLSEAVKANGHTLNIHSAAGRSNRDALQDLLTKSGELYLADIAAGKSVEFATGKHRARTEQVRKEAEKVGFNEKKTRELIGTYGRIPGKKTTDLVLDGVLGVINELKKLYTMQRALALGININLVTGTGTVKNFKAAGGPIVGPGTGTSDDVPIMASNGEFMQQTAAVDYYGVGAMHALNNRQIPKGALQGYATGGLISAVDTSRRWPFVTNMANTKVMSENEATSKVIPAVPSGGRTSDWIVATVRSRFPGIDVLSKDRPGARTLSGNVSYHARGRAVDFEPSKALAAWWDRTYGARTKELITPYQQYNRHNGSRHRYTGAVWNQHNFAGGNAHDHIAMAGGGVIREPVFGVGRSGSTYSFAERGPERVLSTAQTAAGAGRGGPTKVITMTLAPVIHINGAGQSAAQIAAQVDRQLGAQFNQLMRGITG